MISKKMQQLSRELSALAGKNAAIGDLYREALSSILNVDTNVLDQLLSSLTGQQKMLLAHRVNKDGMTIIHKIAETGIDTLQHFQTLERHKILYPELTDSAGKRAIHYLPGHASQFEGFKFLIDRNADTDTPFGDSGHNVGHLLAWNRRTEWLEYMFRKNRDISQPSSDGQTVESILTSQHGADYVSSWLASIMIAQIEVSPQKTAQAGRNRRAL